MKEWGSNGIEIPQKRQREETENSLWIYKDLTNMSFKSHLHITGMSTAYWYFANLQASLIQNSQKIMVSDCFQTGNGDIWKLVLWPFKKPNMTGLYVQLCTNNEKFMYSKPVHIRLRLYLEKSLKFESVVDLNLIKNE